MNLPKHFHDHKGVDSVLQLFLNKTLLCVFIATFEIKSRISLNSVEFN